MGKTKESTTVFKRLVWIDWMKCTGMYFIILGHLFPNYHLFIYVFNVPLFFIISGFLFKREEIHTVFWKKLWYNLIVPMLIISFTLMIYKFFLSFIHGEPDYMRVLKYPVCLIFGMHSALGTCWFVYTLVVIKIIHQFVPPRRIYQLLLVIFFVLAAASLKYKGFSQSYSHSNSIINVCVSYPCFIIGTWLKDYKAYIVRPYSFRFSLLLFVVSVVVVSACGCLGKSVWMYLNGYGDDFMIFLIGGMAGTAAVYVFSKWLEKYDFTFVRTISNGMIIILGFHSDILLLLRQRIIGDTHDYDLLVSLLVLLVFVPIIMLSERYFPLLVGKCRVR